jgi:VanZ family protein
VKRLLKYWLPLFLWAAIIFTFSSLTTPAASQVYWQEFAVKKTAHMIEYGIFAVLLYRALKSYGVKKEKAMILAIVLTFLYGASDEFHQSFTPGREPKVRDIIFDTIGGVLGILFIWKLLPKVPKKLKSWAEKLDLI